MIHGITNSPNIYITKQTSPTAQQNIISFQKRNESDEFIPNNNDLKGSVFESSIKISEKVKEFFGWTNSIDACNHLEGEVEELKEGLQNNDSENIKEEVGDVLFIASQIANKNGINPEEALQETNQKFVNRFQKMQEISDKPLTECSRDQNRTLWNKAKKLIKQESQEN